MEPIPYKDSITSRPRTANRSATRSRSPISTRRKFQRRGTGDSTFQPDLTTDNDDEDKFIMSDSSEHELDDFDSEDDVESGLPAEERRKFLRNQRKRNDLEARVAGVAGKLTKEEKEAADKNVMRDLVTNTALIISWYFFSLSISLVRLPSYTDRYQQLIVAIVQ